MPRIFDGLPASEGIALGRVRLLRWGIPQVPMGALGEEEIEGELARFEFARTAVRARLLGIRDETEARLGPMEAGIFDPQILMLDDGSVVDGVTTYIRDHRFPAPRAFRLRMIEVQAMWSATGNSMVLDRVNDLEDLQIRMLHALLGLPEPGIWGESNDPLILVARNLTPTLTIQLDPERVIGLAADQGTRTSHWAILSRSLGIPAVVGLLDLSSHAKDGDGIIVDGRFGRAILDPSQRELGIYEERKVQLRGWSDDLIQTAHLEAVTRDGQPVSIRGNLDLPMEAERAARHGADGIGLFRTEFLVVGRGSMPEEEEQYQAYRHVLERFQGQAVFIRTYDLGGDKFPTFLHMPAEENPFLGWRAIRVCLDRLELFRPQLRAMLRATVHGDLWILLPMVNDVEEVIRVRELLAEEEDGLRRDGIPFHSGYKLGVLIETPAAALDAAELARHSDFFSIGTNDLVQYSLAVDRTNARLSRLYNPFHPSVVRQLHQVSRAARAAGIEVSLCGEMAATPLGAFLVVGLDIHAISVAWPAIPEIKHVVRSFRSEDARAAARKALAAPTARDVVDTLVAGIGDSVDLSPYSGRWG